MIFGGALASKPGSNGISPLNMCSTRRKQDYVSKHKIHPKISVPALSVSQCSVLNRWLPNAVAMQCRDSIVVVDIKGQSFAVTVACLREPRLTVCKDSMR